MSINYNGLFEILKKNNMSIYKLKSDKIIGTATIDKIRKGVGHIDTRSIESLCKYLNCQPGDLMEYVPDSESAIDTDTENAIENDSAIDSDTDSKIGNDTGAD